MGKILDGAKNSHKVKENFFFSLVDTTKDVNIQTIFHTLPLLCNTAREELMPKELFQTFGRFDEDNISYPLSCYNQALLQAAAQVVEHSLDSEECGSDTRSIAHSLLPKIPAAVPDTVTPQQGLLPPSVLDPSNDIQKKIVPWTNPAAVVNELFPDCLPKHSVSGLVSGSSDVEGDCKSGLILVAALLSKAPNIGGLCRTCEIFGVSELVISNLKVLDDKLFQNLSVTSDKWIKVTEVKMGMLKDYLLSMQRKGYTLVGAEQTAQSKSIIDYTFKLNTVILLGNEREGIPVDLIHLLDDCIEIPQLGLVRSLNVHVSGALLVWEYTKQHLIS